MFKNVRTAIGCQESFMSFDIDELDILTYTVESNVIETGNMN